MEIQRNSCEPIPSAVFHFKFPYSVPFSPSTITFISLFTPGCLFSLFSPLNICYQELFQCYSRYSLQTISRGII